jgi:large subunit ribosomal protein L32
MAVPKKRTSHSKKGLRRGGNKTYKLNIPQVLVNKKTGEFQLSHHVSSDGYYGDIRVIVPRVKKTQEEGAQR